MSKIVSIHSFRGGTGKSNTTANLTVLLAKAGQTVGVVDTDIQSPGIHVLFGLSGESSLKSLNDYLWGRCGIEECAHDVGGRIDDALTGKIHLIPSSLDAREIARVLREGYDIHRLNDGFRALIEGLNLDVLLIDTHPGLNEETLLSIAISDALFVVMRPDKQDYLGTHVTVQIARQLEVPQMTILVNKAPRQVSADSLRTLVENAYQCDVGAILPHSDEMMTLGSEAIFVAQFPDDPITQALQQVANRLME